VEIRPRGRKAPGRLPGCLTLVVVLVRCGGLLRESALYLLSVQSHRIHLSFLHSPGETAITELPDIATTHVHGEVHTQGEENGRPQQQTPVETPPRQRWSGESPVGIGRQGSPPSNGCLSFICAEGRPRWQGRLPDHAGRQCLPLPARPGAHGKRNDGRVCPTSRSRNVLPCLRLLFRTAYGSSDSCRMFQYCNSGR